MHIIPFALPATRSPMRPISTLEVSLPAISTETSHRATRCATGRDSGEWRTCNFSFCRKHSGERLRRGATARTKCLWHRRSQCGRRTAKGDAGFLLLRKVFVLLVLVLWAYFLRMDTFVARLKSRHRRSVRQQSLLCPTFHFKPHFCVYRLLNQFLKI